MQNRVTPEAVLNYLGGLGMVESVSGANPLKSFISIRPAETAKFGSLSYLDPNVGIPEDFKGSMVICYPDTVRASDLFITLLCPKPRLAMAKVIAHFFNDMHDDGFEKFGDGCFEKRTRYTDMNTVYVGACVTIGSEGMGFMRDEKGKLVKFPSVGGVQIHEDVEIADHVSIARGEIGDTIIGAGSKIGHHSYIGPNAVIERDVLIEPHTVIGARCTIEAGVRVEAGAVIIHA